MTSIEITYLIAVLLVLGTEVTNTMCNYGCESARTEERLLMKSYRNDNLYLEPHLHMELLLSIQEIAEPGFQK